MLLSSASDAAQSQKPVAATPSSAAPAPTGAPPAGATPAAGNPGGTAATPNANQQQAAKPLLPIPNALGGASPAPLVDKPRGAYANLLGVANEWKDPCPNGQYTYNPADEVVIGQWHLFGVIIEKRPHNSESPRKLAVGDWIKLGRVNGQDMIIGALGYREPGFNATRSWRVLLLTALECPSFYLAKFKLLFHSDAIALTDDQHKTLKNVVQQADLSDVPEWKDAAAAHSPPEETASPDLQPRQPHPPRPVYVPDKLPVRSKKRRFSVICHQGLADL